MTDDLSREEFERFVRENREMILRILEEDTDSRSFRPYMKDPDEYYSSFRVEARRAGRGILRVLADEEVQKHFTICAMEFIATAEAAVRALPLSDEDRELVDEAIKAKDDAMKNVAVTGVKSVTKSKLEKVNISNVKKKIDGLFPERDSELRKE